MRITISKIKVRGRGRWRVRWHEQGKVKRAHFPSLDSAQARASELRAESLGVMQLLATIPSREQEKLVTLYHEAQRRGVDLMAFLNGGEVQASSSPALSAVIDEMIAAKIKAGRAALYCQALRNVLAEFARGQELMPIHKLGQPEIENYLNSKNLVSRSNYRIRLCTLFNFAIRRGYIIKSPTLQLETITVVRPEPSVFTLDETKRLLKWLLKNPRALGWFCLSTFAGLRPEEAEKTTWADVNFEEKWIRVQAQTSKMRQRRIVYPKPLVFDWLRTARANGAALPVTKTVRCNSLESLRDVVGWPEWKKDVTRHTAASMWLADCGSSETVTHALGHSENILHGRYKALVTKKDAEKFWQLTPDYIKNLAHEN